MIFINTRPVEEQALAINRRKSSGLQKHPPPPPGCDTAKLSTLLVLLYVLLSMVTIVLFYPLSLLSLLIPALLLFFLMAALKRNNQFDVWTASFLATLGLLIKSGAIVTFLSLFDMTPIKGKQSPPLKAGEMDPRTIFFIVVVFCEVVSVVAALCLKWHLVAFRADSELRQVVDQKRKESRISSP